MGKSSNGGVLLAGAQVARQGRPWRGVYGQLLIVALLVGSALFAVYPIKDRFPQQKTMRELDRRIRQERRLSAKLRKDIRLLRESPEYLEATARRSLGLVKPGESAYVVINKPVARQPVEKEDKPDSWTARLWAGVRSWF